MSATEYEVRQIAALHTEKLHLAVQKELQPLKEELSHISAQVETLRRIIVNQPS